MFIAELFRLSSFLSSYFGCIQLIFLIIMYNDSTLFGKCWHISLLKCSYKWRRRFYNMAVERILGHHTTAKEISEKFSMIPFADSGLKLLSIRRIGKTEVLR